MRLTEPMIVGVAGCLWLACTDPGGIIVPPATTKAAPAGELAQRSEHPLLAPTVVRVALAFAEMNDARNRIYVQHVVAGKLDATPKLALLARFVRDYTGMPVKIAAPIPIARLGMHGAQLSSQKLRAALASRLPDDAFALLAVTEADLLSNYYTAVFGEASAGQRVGVVSVARLHLSFTVPGKRSNPAIVLGRSLKLIAHELGHLFGLDHCTAHRCVMNYVTTLRDLDNLPRAICPVGLARMAAIAHFDAPERRRELTAFYTAYGLDVP